MNWSSSEASTGKRSHLLRKNQAYLNSQRCEPTYLKKRLKNMDDEWRGIGGRWWWFWWIWLKWENDWFIQNWSRRISATKLWSEIKKWPNLEQNFYDIKMVDLKANDRDLIKLLVMMKTLHSTRIVKILQDEHETANSNQDTDNTVANKDESLLLRRRLWQN